jgi:hypothetical protein
MFQDDSLSAMDRKKMSAFLSYQKRLDRVQKNVLLKQMIEEEKVRLDRMRVLLEDRKRKEVERRMNEAATKI